MLMNVFNLDNGLSTLGLLVFPLRRPELNIKGAVAFSVSRSPPLWRHCPAFALSHCELARCGPSPVEEQRQMSQQDFPSPAHQDQTVAAFYLPRNLSESPLG